MGVKSHMDLCFSLISGCLIRITLKQASSYNIISITCRRYMIAVFVLKLKSAFSTLIRRQTEPYGKRLRRVNLSAQCIRFEGTHFSSNSSVYVIRFSEIMR
jgi:hypothetical protein